MVYTIVGNDDLGQKHGKASLTMVIQAQSSYGHWQIYVDDHPGHEVIKKITCSTDLSMKFFLLINVKMPTIVFRKRIWRMLK